MFISGFPNSVDSTPILPKLQGKATGSRPEGFCKIGVVEHFVNRRCFFVNFCEISLNTFFHRTPLVAASEKLKTEAVVRRCSVKKVFLEISLNSQDNTCATVLFLQP